MHVFLSNDFIIAKVIFRDKIASFHPSFHNDPRSTMAILARPVIDIEDMEDQFWNPVNHLLPAAGPESPDNNNNNKKVIMTDPQKVSSSKSVSIVVSSMVPVRAATRTAIRVKQKEVPHAHAALEFNNAIRASEGGRSFQKKFQSFCSSVANRSAKLVFDSMQHAIQPGSLVSILVSDYMPTRISIQNSTELYYNSPIGSRPSSGTRARYDLIEESRFKFKFRFYPHSTHFSTSNRLEKNSPVLVQNQKLKNVSNSKSKGLAIYVDPTINTGDLDVHLIVSYSLANESEEEIRVKIINDGTYFGLELTGGKWASEKASSHSAAAILARPVVGIEDMEDQFWNPVDHSLPTAGPESPENNNNKKNNKNKNNKEDTKIMYPATAFLESKSAFQRWLPGWGGVLPIFVPSNTCSCRLEIKNSSGHSREHKLKFGGHSDADNNLSTPSLAISKSVWDPLQRISAGVFEESERNSSYGKSIHREQDSFSNDNEISKALIENGVSLFCFNSKSISSSLVKVNTALGKELQLNAVNEVLGGGSNPLNVAALHNNFQVIIRYEFNFQL